VREWIPAERKALMTSDSSAEDEEDIIDLEQRIGKIVG
jgi:hypothetical protein